MRYVIRHGRRIEVEEHKPDTGEQKKRRRKPFEVKWVKLPRRWAEVLRTSERIATYRLAHIILFEAFKHDQIGREVVLSSTVTKMPREARRHAASELVEFGLIEVERNGCQALRVTKVHIK